MPIELLPYNKPFIQGWNEKFIGWLNKIHKKKRKKKLYHSNETWHALHSTAPSCMYDRAWGIFIDWEKKKKKKNKSIVAMSVNPYQDNSPGGQLPWGRLPTDDFPGGKIIIIIMIIQDIYGPAGELSGGGDVLRGSRPPGELSATCRWESSPGELS